MNKRNVSWNMVGAVVYSVITIILATIVRRTDAAAANAFTFDFKLAQLLLTVGYFEVRVFQVTDSKNKYSFADYLGFRICTCIFMVLCGLVYFMFSGKSFDALPLLMLLVIYKMFDAFADVYEGDYQKNERIDISGKSMALRTLVGAILFTIVIALTGSAVYGCLALVIGVAAVIAVYNPRMLKVYGGRSVRPSFERFGALLKDTGILAVGAIICCYLLNCTSYALDIYAPDFNYIFGALIMPSSVINLAATIIYKPMLTTWTRKSDEKDYRGFSRLLYIMAGIVVGLTLVCMAGAYLIGMPVLSAMYAEELMPYRGDLMLLLAGGGLNALGILTYYGLVVLRKQKATLYTYLITLIGTSFVPFILTKNYGVTGASIAYFIVMLVQFIIFAAFLLYSIRKAMNEKD